MTLFKIQWFLKCIAILMLVALSASLTSCTSLSKLGDSGFESEFLTQEDLEKLNGFYSNSSDSVLGELEHVPYDALEDADRLTILYQLFWNIPDSAWRDSTGKLLDPHDKFISIEFLSRKKATISLYHNESFVFSKSIRGKFKHGYFYIRPKILVIPLIPLVFGYSFERTRIGKNDDMLVIDYTVNRWGFVLFAGSADKGIVSSVYHEK